MKKLSDILLIVLIAIILFIFFAVVAEPNMLSKERPPPGESIIAIVESRFYRHNLSGDEIHLYILFLYKNDEKSKKMVELLGTQEDIFFQYGYSRIQLNYPDPPKSIIMLDLIQTGEGIQAIIETDKMFIGKMFSFDENASDIGEDIMWKMLMKEIRLGDFNLPLWEMGF